MTSGTSSLLKPHTVIASDKGRLSVLVGYGIHIVHDRITDILPFKDLSARHPESHLIDLPDTVLMPGLVNAHQHGRGISALQMGTIDDFLESFLIWSRRRLFLDPGLNARLACARFVAGGVTTVVQANTPLGTGDYERELRSTFSAYDEAGIRAAIAVGSGDRAHLIYPDDETECFAASLDPDLTPFAAPPENPLYAGSLGATIELTDALLREYGSHPRIVVGHGPAGPQWVSDELLAGIADHAKANNLFVHFHGLESLAQLMTVARLYPDGFLNRLQKIGLATPQCSIGHAVYMTDTDVRIAADTGVSFVRNASSNLRLRNGIAPFAEYFRRGVPLGIGTDNFGLGETEDMFAEVRLAGSLARSPFFDGPPPPSAEDLLMMATIGGARLTGHRDVGELRPGAKADLVAIDIAQINGDFMSPDVPLLDAIVQRASACHVVLTMVDGRILFQNGQHMTLDIERLKRDAVTALARATANFSKDTIRRLAAAAAQFHSARTNLEELPPHWEPLALDPHHRF